MSIAFVAILRTIGGSGPDEIPALCWFLFLAGLDGWLIFYFWPF